MVVVSVSVPRLSAFARHENVADAQLMVRRLAQTFDDPALASALPADTLELFSRLPRASRRQFEDQTAVDGAREGGASRSLLLRHGYYFEFLRLPTFAGDAQGVPAVRAWPERCTTPALPSFLALSGKVVLRHDALDPAPGGCDHPPQVASPLVFDLRAHGWTSLAAGDAE